MQGMSGNFQSTEDTSPEHSPRSTNKPNPNFQSNPKPGHTTGGSGRSTGAAQGWIGRDAARYIRQEDDPRSCPPANREQFLERLFGSTNSLIRTCRVKNPDTQRAGRVGAAHSGQWGGAKLGKQSCRHYGRPRRQPSLYPSRVS